VVDDNLTNLEVLQVRLNAQGYEVVTAVDGEDALRRANQAASRNATIRGATHLAPYLRGGLVTA
jgi:CheY-like chemotaxis protein